MASQRSKVRVLIADDHPIFREGLARIIEASGKMEIIAATENGSAAIEAVRNDPPDVAVLDVDMPVLDGIETAKRLKATWPATQIIFLTMHRNRSILQSMASLQVKGYVLKDAAMNEVVSCIETVMAGKSYLSPSLSDLIIGGVAILVIERLSKPTDCGGVSNVTLRHSIGIGLVQCLAMIPGVSRSGATILGAMSFGVDRKTAAEFSFR